MLKKAKVVLQKLKYNFERKGYININHIQIEGREKIAEIGYIFKNLKYEKFRIIYMKEKQIVGEEIINIKIPCFQETFTGDTIGRIKAEICINKIEDRMKQLNANGYYLIHNIPLEVIRISKEKVRVTKYFYKNLDGFKGHLIVNSISYMWIDIIDNNLRVTKEMKIKGRFKIYENRKDMIGVSTINIKNRDDIVYLSNKINDNKNFSIAVVCDIGDIPKMILDIPNTLFNVNVSKIKEYFENISRVNCNSKILFVTDDGGTFKKSIKLLKKNILNEVLWYQVRDTKLYMYKMPEYK